MARPSRNGRALSLVVLAIAVVLFNVAVESAAAQPQFDRQALPKRQPELLARALGELQTAPATQAQLYFVGFAGYGRQSVFKREVLAVRQLFDDRFRTSGRSISLVNHPSTANELPLATAGNLNAVLQRVGKLMNTDRDTLFLFLSSHGVRGRLAVDMPGLALPPLRPAQLRTMLDRAGIKQRVIVVSSCHSGSFIPELAGPQALVIAAARADRSSFGCEDRRRWTYFGDAFFNHALRHEASFRAAFERARRLIAVWEMRDRLLPSLPQIAGGEALAGIE